MLVGAVQLFSAISGNINFDLAGTQKKQLVLEPVFEHQTIDPTPGRARYVTVVSPSDLAYYAIENRQITTGSLPQAE